MDVQLKAMMMALMVCASLSARAQSPEERLVSMNAYVERGMQALDFDWASDPTTQAARIAAADEVSVNVKRALTPEVQASPFYPPFAKNLARLDEAVAGARIGNSGAFARRQAIEALGRRDVVATKAALDGVGAVIKRLAGTSGAPKATTWLVAEKKNLDKNLAQLEQALVGEKKAMMAAEAAAAAASKARQQAELRAQAEANIVARERAAVDAKLRAQAEAELRQAEKAEEERRAAALKAETKAKIDAEAKARADDKARLQAEAKAKADADLVARADEKARLKAEKQAAADAAAAARAADAAAAAAARRQVEADRVAAEQLKAKESPVTKAVRLSRERRDDIVEALRTRTGTVPTKLMGAASDAVRAVRLVDSDRGALEDAALQQLVLRSAARATLTTTSKAPLDARVIRQVPATVPTAAFDLTEGWCYAWVSSSDGYFKVALEATAPVSTFQQSTSTSSQLGGFCTAQDGKATARITKDDPKAALTIFGWPAMSLPMALSLHARLEAIDVCNEAATLEAWRTPLPGAVVFVADTVQSRKAVVPPGPVLVLSPGTPSSPLAKVLGVDGVEREVATTLLVDTVVVGASPLVPVGQCPAAGPRLVEAADPLECRKPSDAVASPLVLGLGDRLARTTDDERRLVIERELRALDDETARRRAGDCRAVEVSPTRAWRRRHHDALVAVAPRSGQRARLLVLETTELP